MARGINKVILVGNLGADPEFRETARGGVCNLRLATSDSWKDKQTGQMQERVEWHQVTAFGRLAEVCADYLRKGKQIYIEGELRTEKWTDRDGVERYTTKIYASEMQMLGGTGTGASEARQRQRSQAPAQGAPRGGDDGLPPGGLDMAGDVPDHADIPL